MPKAGALADPRRIGPALSVRVALVSAMFIAVGGVLVFDPDLSCGPSGVKTLVPLAVGSVIGIAAAVVGAFEVRRAKRYAGRAIVLGVLAPLIAVVVVMMAFSTVNCGGLLRL